MELVVGVGNTLRSDDGVGARVVESLSHDRPVETLIVQQLTLALVEPLMRAERVLFVDADAAGDRVQLAPLRPAENAPRLGHAMSAEELLRWTLIERDVCPAAWMLSVPGRSFELGEELSPETQNALPAACRAALNWLDGRSHERPNEEDE